MSKNILIGKKVDKLFINQDKTIIKVQCGDLFIDLITDADCCSETWIEHTSDLISLVGHSITGVEEVTLGEVMPTRQDYDQLYAFKITHDGCYYGDCGIEFRNSSNGYYGGTLYIAASTGTLEGFSEITEDF